MDVEQKAETLSEAAVIGLACAWVLLTVTSLVGNSLVIVAVLLSQKLRTVTNAFVVNLSVADVWMSLSYPWMVVAITGRGKWPMESEIPCTYAAAQFFIGLGAHMYSLAAIALNRMMLTSETLDTYRWWCNVNKVSLVIFATWLAVLLPVMFNIGVLGYDAVDNTCTDKGDHGRADAFHLIQLIVMLGMPIAICIVAYLSLYVTNLRRNANRRTESNIEPDSPIEATASFTLELSSNASELSSRVRSDDQAITNCMLIVSCVALVLVFPYGISLGARTSGEFDIYGMTLAILTSTVNPVIYTVYHPHFKVVIRNMIRCRFSDIPEPSIILSHGCCKRFL